MRAPYDAMADRHRADAIAIAAIEWQVEASGCLRCLAAAATLVRAVWAIWTTIAVCWAVRPRVARRSRACATSDDGCCAAAVDGAAAEDCGVDGDGIGGGGEVLAAD